MKPLKKARLCLLVPLFVTGLLLIFSFLLLFGGISPELLPSAYVYILESKKVYLTMNCPDLASSSTSPECGYNAGLSPIKWAAQWYWASVVALATALSLQSYLVYRPDPRWAMWAARALLPAASMLAMGCCIAFFIRIAAEANSGKPNQTFTGLSIVMTVIACADWVTMWYLKSRFRKKPVPFDGPPYPGGGMSLGLPTSTRPKQHTGHYELESEDDKATLAAATHSFTMSPEVPDYGTHPSMPSRLAQTHRRGAAPGRPSCGDYPGGSSGGYGGYGERGGYQ